MTNDNSPVDPRRGGKMIPGVAAIKLIVQSIVDVYRTTTDRLNANRGSSQYQAMNFSIAYSYIRRECEEASALSTAALDCSNSGMVSAAERLTDLRCCCMDIGNGPFNRLPSSLLTDAQ